MTNDAVVEAASAGLRSLGYRVVVTGAPHDAADDRVLFRRWAPMVRLVAASSVVVAHGGMGTVTAAVAAGTPVIVVPQAFDHPLTALRLEAAGIGISVDDSSLTARAISDATRSLSTDAVRQRCLAVAEEIASTPSIRSVLGRVEQHASTATTGTA